jgi:tetratricopeptide (TPR) repeat protein
MDDIGAPQELNEVLKKGDDLEAQGRLDEAVAVFEGFLKKWPNIKVPGVYDRLGNLYAEKENYDQAEKVYLQAQKFDPNDYQLHYNLGVVYMESGQVQKARECFHRAIGLNPAFHKALINLSELINRPEEAIDFLEKALRLSPGEKDLPKALAMWRNLATDTTAMGGQRLFWAEQAIQKNDLKQARLHLALAQEEPLDGNLRALAFQLESNVLRKGENLQASIAKLETAAEIDPSRPWYWNTLSARKYLLALEPNISPGDRDRLLQEGEEAGYKAISLGDYAKPHQNLASIFLSRGLLTKAREKAEEALHLVQQQRQQGSSGTLICQGCPTGGESEKECLECLRKAQQILADLRLANGDYQIPL